MERELTNGRPRAASSSGNSARSPTSSRPRTSAATSPRRSACTSSTLLCVCAPPLAASSCSSADSRPASTGSRHRLVPPPDRLSPPVGPARRARAVAHRPHQDDAPHRGLQGAPVAQSARGQAGRDVPVRVLPPQDGRDEGPGRAVQGDHGRAFDSSLSTCSARSRTARRRSSPPRPRTDPFSPSSLVALAANFRPPLVSLARPLTLVHHPDPQSAARVARQPRERRLGARPRPQAAQGRVPHHLSRQDGPTRRPVQGQWERGGARRRREGRRRDGDPVALGRARARGRGPSESNVERVVN